VDLRTCYCRNSKCMNYGQATGVLSLHPYGNHRHAPRLQCRECVHLVWARSGTAYAGIRTLETTYRLGAKLLAEGLAIRATSRILEVDKDTVCQWVPRLGRHSLRVMAYFFRNLHISECQLDELWTFVQKKEYHLEPIEQVLGVYGDAWIWIAFAPHCKLIVTWMVGKRTVAEAKRLIKCLKMRLDGQIPFFTSDQLPHYAEALLDQYGELYQPPKPVGRGRPPLPYKIPPPDLLYAVVVKRREQGRVVEVSTEIIYGAPERIAEVLQASPTSSQISTYGVERNNLTIRQHSRRMGRKVNAFSKDRDYLKYQLALAFAYYHFVIPHRGLRQRLEQPQPTKGCNGSPKKWIERTPAMAAGLTDHIWTMDELLSFRVPPKSKW
jgi:IS1 family transposase/transposase-like protein